MRSQPESSKQVGVGSRLGRYELLARLATGGMGEIFLARLEGAAGFEKLFVIKRILPHLADDGRFRTMFIDEARIVANMSHANICQVYELDETDNRLFLVMEYLEGVPLLALLRKYAREHRYLDLGAIAGIVQQAAEGLHFAHELRNREGKQLGLVHRDVTPSNIFLTTSGVVKIHDFGIAKVKDAQMTDTGTIKGKYAYMAPEQLRGQTLDRRADLFALGVVAFETLTCRPLFQRKTDYLTFRAVMEQPLPALQSLRPDAPASLAAVVERALALDPAARFDNLRQFASAFCEAISEVERPWSQGEVSELVRVDFVEEISDRNRQIAEAVNSASKESRQIPLIASPRPPRDGSDGAEYFSFETSVEVEPVPSGGTPGRGKSIPVTGSVPGVRAQPLSQVDAPAARAPTSTAIAMRGGWPIAAIGGAVAVLVVGLIAIELTGGGGDAKRDGDAPAAAAALATEGKQPRGAGGSNRTVAADPFAEALAARRISLDDCLARHGDALAAGTRALVTIALDGSVKKVSLHPDVPGGTPLHGCIRSALQTVSFPPAATEQELSLGLAVQR